MRQCRHVLRWRWIFSACGRMPAGCSRMRKGGRGIRRLQLRRVWKPGTLDGNGSKRRSLVCVHRLHGGLQRQRIHRRLSLCTPASFAPDPGQNDAYCAKLRIPCGLRVCFGKERRLIKLNPPQYQQQVVLHDFCATLLPFAAEDLSQQQEIFFKADTMHHAILIATAEAESRSLRLTHVRDLGLSPSAPA